MFSLPFPELSNLSSPDTGMCLFACRACSFINNNTYINSEAQQILPTSQDISTLSQVVLICRLLWLHLKCFTWYGLSNLVIYLFIYLTSVTAYQVVIFQSFLAHVIFLYPILLLYIFSLSFFFFLHLKPSNQQCHLLKTSPVGAWSSTWICGD